MGNNVIELRPRNRIMLAPAEDQHPLPMATDKTSDPLKSLEDIEKMATWFADNNRWRDYMLFIVGINFGLRVSDLLTLRFEHLIDNDMTFRTEIVLLEKKTSETRTRKSNRHIYINDAVADAVTLYLQKTEGVKLDDFLFRSESNNGKEVNKPMARQSVGRILKEAAKACGITAHVSTHTLRKTFGYHQMVMGGNSPRRLLLLQKMFGHSSSAITLDYIGLTGEEIEEAYKELNLGKMHTSSYIARAIG